MEDIKVLLDSITVNTQSSVRFEYDGFVYYVDPYEIADAPHDADFLFFTHDHYDHFDPPSIQNVLKSETLVVFPVRMAEKVKEVVGHVDVLPVLPNEFYEDGPMEVDTIPSYNLNKDFHPESAGWVGYVFHLGDFRLYVSGDMDATEDASDVSADIAMLPIGGTYTMTPEEAAELTNDIAPEVVIPTHYGSIVGSKEDGETFAALVDEGTTVVFKL